MRKKTEDDCEQKLWKIISANKKGAKQMKREASEHVAQFPGILTSIENEMFWCILREL